MKVLARLQLLIALLLLPACFSVKAYVDPKFHKAGYGTIQRPAQPTPLRLVAEFQRNGERMPAADQELSGHLDRVLRDTGVFAPGGGAGAPARLRVVANNIADLADARSKGIGTGLTFGAAGSTVSDNYEFTFEYTRADGTAVKTTYQHVIHSVVGNGDGPEGMTPTTLADAFGRVVEDVTLNFLADMQAGGKGP
ncbi:MAG: hypothetical protein QM820_63010 [Minicystis sp.]